MITRLKQFIMLISLGLVIYMMPAALTIKHRTVTISKAENVCRKSKDPLTETLDCRYLVFTNVTTFENTDDIRFLKGMSSDWNGRFAEGGCWHITTVGVRFGPLDWYPNIVKAKKCRENEKSTSSL